MNASERLARRRIEEENLLREVQTLDQLIMKDLFVFRMAMANQSMKGARQRALNAADRLLTDLERHFGC